MVPRKTILSFPYLLVTLATLAGSSVATYIEYSFHETCSTKTTGFHFSNIYEPQALISSNFKCELYIHLFFAEALEMEKNSHFVEFEVLSCIVVEV